MKRLDCWFGIFWLLLSLGVCIRSYQIGLGDMRNPGPGFLFFVSGVILLGLSLLVLVPAFRTPVQDDEKNIFGNVNWKKVIAIIVTLTGYGLALEPLGFLISTVFFIGFLLYSIGAKRWGVVISVSLVSTALIYVLFVIVLQSSLPRGITGI